MNCASGLQSSVKQQHALCQKDCLWIIQTSAVKEAGIMFASDSTPRRLSCLMHCLHARISTRKAQKCRASLRRVWMQSQLGVGFMIGCISGLHTCSSKPFDSSPMTASLQNAVSIISYHMRCMYRHYEQSCTRFRFAEPA